MAGTKKVGRVKTKGWGGRIWDMDQAGHSHHWEGYPGLALSHELRVSVASKSVMARSYLAMGACTAYQLRRA